MIIEDFLYAENIDESLANTLIDKYPNLSFITTDEFYRYFQSQNVHIVKNDSKSGNDALQKFKDFKSSADYQSVRKYILEQKRIQVLIASGDISTGGNVLDSISHYRVDSFFDFIIRKIVTGSESGQLPSEQLQQMIDGILKTNTVDIDVDSDVIRDDIGSIQSFKNYLKNRGSLAVNVLDDRFLIESFNYVVNRGFSQLDSAVNAESNVLKNASGIILDDVTDDNILDELKKLISSDSTSIPALQNVIEDLTTKLDNINELMDSKEQSIDDLSRTIEELSDQRNNLLQEIDVRDDTIVQLNDSINSTLQALEEKLKAQLENNSDAFDALSDKLEAQAKKSEENSSKQLDAFQSAISGLTSGLTSALSKPDDIKSDPEDSPEEVRRKDKIRKIQSDWDSIKYISVDNDDHLDAILKIVGSSIGTSRTKFVDLKGSLPSRASQVYMWNSSYKDQFKNLMTVSLIKKESDADAILTLMDKLKTTSDLEKPTRTFVYNSTDAKNGDILDKWRDDINRTKGDNAAKVQDIHGLVGATYDGQTTTALENKLRTVPFDTIIDVLGLVNEFPNKGYA